MEAAASAISLVDASLNLLGNLKAYYDEYDKIKIPDGVKSIQRDLESIKEAVGGGGGGPAAATNAGHRAAAGTSSWMSDLRAIKLRIEDVIELYNLEFGGGETAVRFEGAGARVGDKAVSKLKRVVSPAGWRIRGYLKEIEHLTAEANKRVRSFHPQTPAAATTPAELQGDLFFNHDNETDPVGLGAPMEELVRMLSDATLLRVVAISSPDGASGRSEELGRVAYEKVKAKEGFAWKAYVTAAPNDCDGKRLLKDILEQLLGRRQRGKSVSQLTQILKNLLKNKRYIIGIDSLETTKYWDDVLSAFPDDNMSSRVIVTTIHDDIARTCRKNCPVYRMQALGTKSFKEPSRSSSRFYAKVQRGSVGW